MPKSTPKPPTKASSKPVAKRRKKTSPAVSGVKKPQHTAPAELPGYVAFTRHVGATLWSHRQVFGRLALLAWALLLLGNATVEYTQYTSLSEATREAVSIVSNGGSRAAVGTWVLFSSVLGGSLTGGLSEGQQIFRTGSYLMVWLTVVWLLRHLLAGTVVRVRDGLYNAGAPLISALLVVMVGALQLLPLALLVSIFAALLNTGALNHVLIIALMGAITVALSVATLYWLTNTFFAFVIVTIPGTYPLAALRSARKLIAGYRVAVLLRLLWLGLVLSLLYTVVLLPLLYLDAALNAPVSFLVVTLSELIGVVAVLFGSAYVYMLYRKVIDGRTE